MREKILELLETSYDALDIMTIANLLNLTSVEDIKSITYELNVLVSDLTVYLTKKNKYILYSKCPNFRKGKIEINKSGNGFLILDLEDDLFVPRESLNYALDNDLVLVEVLTKDGKKEGRVIKVIERDLKNVVGIIKSNGNYLYFQPINKNLNITLYIDNQELKSCVEGEIVVATITNNLGKNKFDATIKIHVCHKDDAKEDILTIAAKYEIYHEFPDDVIKELKSIPNEISKNELNFESITRVDLRDEVIFTIDGDDTKDIDDAISLKYENGLYNLKVSIADVSYYVKENSPLDKEALRRGTSSYLADSVIPMLPHKLSNGICSLNPNVDRFAITCSMFINESGEVVDSNIYPSIIRSRKKMTYKNVNNILNDICVEDGYQEYVNNLKLMQHLAHIIREERMSRGASNFETVEAKIICDDNGKSIGIKKRIQDEGEKLIEDFMVIANETVASTLENMDLPSLYRVHDIPKQERIEKFLTYLKNAGYHIVGKFNNVTKPKIFQKLLDQILEQGDESGIINSLAVRTMNKAYYSTDNIHHFGLASRSYTHFTSPIRRYPDLEIHRLLRTYLFEGKINKETITHFENILPNIAEISSNREVASVEAEREVLKIKSAEYMEDHIGEEFDAYVSGVLKKGFFVQTVDLVEGLVSVDTLKGDYYQYSEELECLIGENSKKRFSLGDKVKVKCVGANKALGEIDFELIGVETKNIFKKKKKR